jgi:hypothetical protein
MKMYLPQLASLSFGGPDPHDMPPHLTLSSGVERKHTTTWQSMVEIAVQNHGPDVVFWCMSEMPRLQFAKFDQCDLMGMRQLDKVKRMLPPDGSQHFVFTRLTHLSLRTTQVDMDLFSVIFTLPQLLSLTMSHNMELNSLAFLGSLLSSNTTSTLLNRLEVFDCPHLTFSKDTLPSSASFPQLTHLNIGSMLFIDEEHHLPSIVSLDSIAVPLLFNMMPNLRSLVLPCCRVHDFLSLFLINDGHLLLPNLTTLDLTHVYSFRSVDLGSLLILMKEQQILPRLNSILLPLNHTLPACSCAEEADFCLLPTSRASWYHYYCISCALSELAASLAISMFTTVLFDQATVPLEYL